MVASYLFCNKFTITNYSISNCSLHILLVADNPTFEKLEIAKKTRATFYIPFIFHSSKLKKFEVWPGIDS